MAEGDEYQGLPCRDYNTLVSSNGGSKHTYDMCTNVRKVSTGTGDAVSTEVPVVESHQIPDVMFNSVEYYWSHLHRGRQILAVWLRNEIKDTVSEFSGRQQADRDERVESQMKENIAEMERMSPFDVAQVQRWVSELKRERKALEIERDRYQEAIRDIDKKFLSMYSVLTTTLQLYSDTYKDQTGKVTELHELCSELQDMTYSRNEETDVLKQKTKILENRQRIQHNAQMTAKTEIDQLSRQMKSLEVRYAAFERNVDGQLRQQLSQPTVKPGDMQAMWNALDEMKVAFNRLRRDLLRPEPAAVAQTAPPPVNISINSPINNYVSPCTNAQSAPTKSGVAGRQNIADHIDVTGNRDIAGRQWRNDDSESVHNPVSPPEYQLQAELEKASSLIRESPRLPSYSSISLQPTLPPHPNKASLLKPPEDHSDSGASTMPP